MQPSLPDQPDLGEIGPARLRNRDGVQHSRHPMVVHLLGTNTYANESPRRQRIVYPFRSCTHPTGAARLPRLISHTRV